MHGYFDAHATRIQRHLCGSWSRNHMCSSCERQAWLAAVACKNVEVKELCQREYESALRWMTGH